MVVALALVLFGMVKEQVYGSKEVPDKCDSALLFKLLEMYWFYLVT